MYNGLLHLHNFMRWVILLFLILVMIQHLMGLMRKSPISKLNKNIALILLIASDLTLLVGLYQWISGHLGLKLIQAAGMAEVMKDKAARFFAVEHAVGMIIAIIFIHIGYSFSKKVGDSDNHTKAFAWYFIAFLLIMATIPWAFREGIGRAWFPGM